METSDILFALSPLCHIYHTTWNRLFGSWVTLQSSSPISSYFSSSNSISVKRFYPFLIHIHVLSAPNPPIIIPPTVPFSRIIKICPRVCIHTSPSVCVWLIGLSAGCDLCLLDSKIPRPGIAFYSFFLLCPPHQQYASL